MKLVSGLSVFDGKIVKSGDILEIYKYEKGVFTGSTGSRGRNGQGKDKERNRELVISRARREIRRIINANVNAWGEKPKFLTLTFAENVQDLETANYEFGKFLKRLNYACYKTKKHSFKYTCVVEFQERGAIHYHVIFYNLPYIESSLLAYFWRQGFIKINAIDDVTNVGAYVCKYLTKANDDDRLRGKKCYFNSRGLVKPVEFYLDYDDLERYKEKLPQEALVYEAEFKNEYVGTIKYEQYNLSISECDVNKKIIHNAEKGH